MKTITKESMERAAKLSSEWNNTAFFIINKEGKVSELVWNHYQYRDPRPETVGYVNGNKGFVITNPEYQFEVSGESIIN